MTFEEEIIEKIVNPINKGIANTFIKLLEAEKIEYFIGGSYRFGYFTQKSDLDIFISFKDETEREKLYKFLNHLNIEKDFGKIVYPKDIIVFRGFNFLNIFILNSTKWIENYDYNFKLANKLETVSLEEHNNLIITITILKNTYRFSGTQIFNFLLQYFSITDQYIE